ncbi:MAG: hypothetical protein H0W15_10040 [Gemmatimonadales bacterium]|nr:hypothetical protein [Gemmatimonadales bacterium]
MSAHILEARAHRIRTSRIAAWMLAAVMVGLALGAWAIRFDASPRWGSLGGMLVITIGAWIARRRPVTARTVARHIDRTVLRVEESAELLLTDPDTVVGRIQRQRVIDALAMSSIPPMRSATMRTALGMATLAGVALAIALLLPTEGAAEPREATPVARVATLTISAVEVRWTPPAYTGRPSRTAAATTNSAEEGSMVTWSARVRGAETVRVISSAGDTLVATPDGDTWAASISLTRPLVWRVEATRGSQTVRTEDRLIMMIADQPPLLSILAPPTRIVIDWTEPHVVVARALVRDDHGLGRTRLIALVGGRGEGATFREQTLAVEVESRRGRAAIVVSRLVNLDSLGVAPGDEVLLTFEAFDRRQPRPQSARSETIFITMLDTATTSTATLPGIALQVEPAVFRSQRQIILDTEALLRDIRLGRGGDVMRRSMDIGYEQHLLRIRYGELVGEENEGGPGEPADEDHVVTADDFRHDHDMAENATLLSTGVKTLLKRALSSMWEAEKQLRTGRAAAALPSEYAALESLEEIRRASRAYVKRIGFEPPAIDVRGTRLTRFATSLAPLTGGGTPVAEDPDIPIRDALVQLEHAGARRRDALQAAGVRLAARATEGAPGSVIETLGLLRRVIDGCEQCVAGLRERLLAALPQPGPPLIRRPAAGHTP